MTKKRLKAIEYANKQYNYMHASSLEDNSEEDEDEEEGEMELLEMEDVEAEMEEGESQIDEVEVSDESGDEERKRVDSSEDEKPPKLVPIGKQKADVTLGKRTAAQRRAAQESESEDSDSDDGLLETPELSLDSDMDTEELEELEAQ